MFRNILKITSYLHQHCLVVDILHIFLKYGTYYLLYRVFQIGVTTPCYLSVHSCVYVKRHKFSQIEYPHSLNSKINHIFYSKYKHFPIWTNTTKSVFGKNKLICTYFQQIKQNNIQKLATHCKIYLAWCYFNIKRSFKEKKIVFQTIF